MQGFNMGRYVPPDIEGTKLTGNALHRRRPPGHSSAGAGQTVRFEMPFAIWCSTCPKPTIIGQGVRFNAQKSRDGNYFSTPIWSFRMRHAACGGEIVIRTDPKNTAYEVISGATKRDYGDEKQDTDQDAEGGEHGVGAGAIITDAEREELRKNAFAKLERTIDDREKLRRAGERLEDLMEASSRDWDDPYARNQRLRKAFRVGRKQRERDATETEALRDRMGLGIELLPASEEDARRAAVVDFLPGGEGGYAEEGRAMAKPLFASSKNGEIRDGRAGNRKKQQEKPKGTTKAERQAEARKSGFVSQVMGNTRMVRDPFLNGNSGGGGDGKTLSSARRLPVTKKRKRDEAQTVENEPRTEAETKTKTATTTTATTSALVTYDSDSD